MQAGAPIIVQGALQSARWSGRADVLRRVETPSVFGAWSYEVVDTKLAKETKGNTVLQISLYSDLLAATQKSQPEFSYVVAPELEYEARPFRVTDYAAYYRHVRKSLEDAVATSVAQDAYPEPNPHCDVCRWREHCDDKRRSDDHLSLVAGISKVANRRAKAARRDHDGGACGRSVASPVETRTRCAPRATRKSASRRAFRFEGRTQGKIIHETLPIVPGFGLTRLPQALGRRRFLRFRGRPVRGRAAASSFCSAMRSADDKGATAFTRPTGR